MSDLEKMLKHGYAPSTEPVPPSYHVGMAGHHWVERIDYDGRSCGLEVYQWQPSVKKWCRPNEYAQDRDVDLTGYRYVAVCPTPMFEEEAEEVKKIFDDLQLRFTSGNSVPVTKAQIGVDQYEKLRRLHYDYVGIRVKAKKK